MSSSVALDPQPLGLSGRAQKLFVVCSDVNEWEALVARLNHRQRRDLLRSNSWMFGRVGDGPVQN